MTGPFKPTGVANRRGPAGPGPRELQQAKLAVIGQLASNLAHELSNPIATILLSAESIRSRKRTNPTGPSREQPLTAQAWDDLDLILSEARRASEILGGLLTFARQDTPEPQPTRIADILRHTEALSRHHLDARNITLQVDIRSVGTHDRWAVNYPNQLQQVILNVIINAVQAIAETKSSGKIAIVVRGDSDDAAPAAVIISVEDDGPGVPPELRRIIFQQFYTTKSPGRGTGLGLSISASIMRAQSGDIWVEDGRDGGARFLIRVPLCRAPRHGMADSSKPDKDGEHVVAARDGRAVLLVDDDPAVRGSVSRLLRHLGYQVETVSTGDAAIAMLRSREFDAVVLDLRMSGMSGEQCFYLIKHEFPGMASRVIFATGDTGRRGARDFLERSGRPVLYKPYELSQLATLLEAMCQTAEQHDRSRQSADVGDQIA